MELPIRSLRLLDAPRWNALEMTPGQGSTADAACLDLVSSAILARAEDSSAREATLIWLAELVLRMGVPGDVMEHGSRSATNAVLLHAVMHCAGGARQLHTDDWHKDMARWAEQWSSLQGAGAWDVSSRLRRGGGESAPLALLVCGSPRSEGTRKCLAQGAPRLSRGGIVFVAEYWKHGGCRRAADAYRLQAGAGGSTLYSVGEHSRQAFGFDEGSGGGSSARPPLRFADIGRVQRLTANLTLGDPLLERSDKCCTDALFDPARCCKPHAVFWQHELAARPGTE